MVASRISFGKIEFDDIHGQLLCEGKPIAISQRTSALLGALIQANGQAVSKTELMEKAWPDLIVEEGNLTVQIAALRKALGTTEDGNDWIVTVPRVGYRLLQQQSRWCGGRHHHRTVSFQKFRRHRPQFNFCLQGPCGRCP